MSLFEFVRDARSLKLLLDPCPELVQGWNPRPDMEVHDAYHTLTRAVIQLCDNSINSVALERPEYCSCFSS